MLLNCGAGEDSWKSLGQQGDQTNPKGNQLWIFIGRIDAEAPIIWSPDIKCQFIGKDPDAGKHWRQEERGVTEDEMVGWHHWLNGHEFEWTPGAGDEQGGLACCSPWSHKESDTTEQLTLSLHFFTIGIFVHLYPWQYELRANNFAINGLKLMTQKETNGSLRTYS